MSELWNRPTGPPDQEWTFWQKLAATCLSDTTISGILERRSVSELTNCSQEGLSVIESLLVGQNCVALCIRYLAGVLDLPGFWQNLGSAHSQVADKLCCRMVQVLKDIGVDIPTLGLIEEAPVDYDGVDLAATTLLGGLSSWFRKLDRDDWAMQPWPRAVEILPYSSASATSTFDDVLPTIYQDRVLNVMVDNQNNVPGDRATPAGNQSTDNLSAYSIRSDGIRGGCGRGVGSPGGSRGAFNLDSEGMPPEESTPDANSDTANREFAAATGSHPVADQACVASGCGLSGGWPVLYFILYPLSEEPSWSQDNAYLPFSQLISELSEEHFAVLNREPGRTIKFNFRECGATKRSNSGGTHQMTKT
ncbi:hypothetical protein B0H14DRAFT_3689877 [Mycena olivaceomarginata]|nr:hypothetical protein B0H14DRAFT_3689877 [Mycena olivaceomarginata]